MPENNNQIILDSFIWVIILVFFAAVAEIPFSYIHSIHFFHGMKNPSYINSLSEFFRYLFGNGEHLMVFSTIIIAAILNEILFHRFENTNKLFQHILKRFVQIFSSVFQIQNWPNKITKIWYLEKKRFSKLYHLNNIEIDFSNVTVMPKLFVLILLFPFKLLLTLFFWLEENLTNRIIYVLGVLYIRWIQVINATPAELFNFSAKTSLGVLNPNLFLGRLFKI
jgi:hypothetical protein